MDNPSHSGPRIHVKGFFLERGIADCCDKWAELCPIDFAAYVEAMRSAHTDLITGKTGRIDVEVPKGLHSVIAEWMTDNGKPNYQWTSDPDMLAAFKKIFIIGVVGAENTKDGRVVI